MTERNLTGSIPNSFFLNGAPGTDSIWIHHIFVIFFKTHLFDKKGKGFRISLFHFLLLSPRLQAVARPLLLTILILFWSMVIQNLRFQRFLKDPSLQEQNGDFIITSWAIFSSLRSSIQSIWVNISKTNKYNTKNGKRVIIWQ